MELTAQRCADDFELRFGNLLSNSCQSPAGFFKVGVRFGETEPDEVMTVGPREECFSWHPRNAGLIQEIHRSFFAGLPRQTRDIGQHVVSPLWDRRCEAGLLQRMAEAIPLFLKIPCKASIK